MSALVVALLAALVYLPALRNGLATDDVVIFSNPLLKTAGTLPATLTSPWWFDTGHLYRPLSLFSLGVEHVIAGGAPWLPHAVNVALHALVAALVTRFYTRWVPLRAALVGGVLFAVAPVHAEAVSSIVGRCELVAGLAIVSLLLFVTHGRVPSVRSRLLVAALSAAALAGKESGVAAPVLVLAAAWASPADRRHATRWALAALAGTVTLLVARLAALGTLGGDLPHPAFRVVPMAGRIALALAMLPRTALTLLLPIPPYIDYTPRLDVVLHPGPLWIAAGTLLVAAVLWALLRHPRRPSVVTLGLILLAAPYAPVSNLVFAGGAPGSGRTLYAASIGFFLLVAATVARLERSRLRPLVPVAAGAMALSAMLVTWREARVWRDTASVLAAKMVRQPDDYQVPMFAAYAARDAGDAAEALADFRAAAALFPADAEMLTDAATVALRERDTVTAEGWLRTAVNVNPREVRARTRLATLRRAAGDDAGARALIAEGLRLDPHQRLWAAWATAPAR